MRFLSRFLRSRRPPAVANCEEWRPGDIAECISDGPWFRDAIEPVASGPVTGDRLIVRKVGSSRHPIDGEQHQVLTFSEWPDRRFDGSCFRKVQPRADQAIAATAEFVADLHRHTRRKELA